MLINKNWCCVCRLCSCYSDLLFFLSVYLLYLLCQHSVCVVGERWAVWYEVDSGEIILWSRAVLKAAPLSCCQRGCQRAVPGQGWHTEFTLFTSGKCCVSLSPSELSLCVCVWLSFSAFLRNDSSSPSMPTTVPTSIGAKLTYLCLI